MQLFRWIRALSQYIYCLIRHVRVIKITAQRRGKVTVGGRKENLSHWKLRSWIFKYSFFFISVRAQTVPCTTLQQSHTNEHTHTQPNAHPFIANTWPLLAFQFSLCSSHFSFLIFFTAFSRHSMLCTTLLELQLFFLLFKFFFFLSFSSSSFTFTSLRFKWIYSTRNVFNYDDGRLPHKIIRMTRNYICSWLLVVQLNRKLKWLIKIFSSHWFFFFPGS